MSELDFFSRVPDPDLGVISIFLGGGGLRVEFYFSRGTDPNTVNLNTYPKLNPSVCGRFTLVYMQGVP